jgi:ElaB/YqjD/DUF883 family membrane-anchored ribosome-binding protein
VEIYCGICDIDDAVSIMSSDFLAGPVKPIEIQVVSDFRKAAHYRNTADDLLWAWALCHCNVMTPPEILLIKEMKIMPAEVLEKPVAAEETRRDIPKIRAIVSDAMEDRVRSASRAIRHGRYAAEDLIDQAEHKVKQRPFQVLGIVFAAGVLIGGLVSWIGFRRR